MKRFLMPAIAAVLFTTGATLHAVTLDVHDFGATGDGKTSDTVAIQKAVDACHGQGGGTVRFGAGQFVSGTILLKDGVSLRLETNTTLLGSLEIGEYQNPDPFTSGNGAALGFCFIGAVDAHNVGIEGPGTIDGRGKELLDARPKGNNARPFLVRFVRCDGVTVSDVHLTGPAAWTMHFFQSSNVVATGVKIVSLGLGNNDGMDIDSCRNVNIRGCDIDSGDDAICLKTTSAQACRDVMVTDCDLKSHWAAVKFGTESAGDFLDITVTNCRIRDTQGGGIKICSVDGANVSNVLVSGVTMDNVTLPVFVRLGARLKTFREGETKRPVGTVRDVVIRDVKANATWPIGVVLSGIPDHALEDITFSNVELHLPGGGTAAGAGVKLEEKEAAYPEISMFGKIFPAYGVFARHIHGLKLHDVTIYLAAADGREATLLEDATDVENGVRTISK